MSSFPQNNAGIAHRGKKKLPGKVYIVLDKPEQIILK